MYFLTLISANSSVHVLPKKKTEYFFMYTFLQWVRMHIVYPIMIEFDSSLVAKIW